jgi:hypothetical protein
MSKQKPSCRFVLARTSVLLVASLLGCRQPTSGEVDPDRAQQLLARLGEVSSDAIPADRFIGVYFQGTSHDTFRTIALSSQLSFDWGHEAPAAGLPADRFSAIYGGDFGFEKAERVFSLSADDGAKVYLDDTKVLDTSAGRTQQTVPVSEGTHIVVVEYVETTGPASLHLSMARANDGGVAAGPGGGTDEGLDSVGTDDPGSPGPLTSSASWQNRAITERNDLFEAELTVTPHEATVNGVVALSDRVIGSYDDAPILLRFAPDSGLIEARDGARYAADEAVPYEAGNSYHVRLVGDLVEGTYSVFVVPEGGEERPIAHGFAFRAARADASAVDQLGIIAETGSFSLSGFTSRALDRPVEMQAGAVCEP